MLFYVQLFAFFELPLKEGRLFFLFGKRIKSKNILFS